MADLSPDIIALRAKLKVATLGQESGNGTADTTQPNYAGAIGPGQIIPATFDGLKNKGLIPKTFDINNPADNRAASGALLDNLMDKFDNDPQRASAAYYAGEGVVRGDGSIANYIDRKNPSAPTTHQYVAQVMGRMDQPVTDFSGGGYSLDGTAPPKPTMSDWATMTMPPQRDVRPVLSPKDLKVPLTPIGTPTNDSNPIADGLAANTVAEQKATADYNANGLTELAQAQFPWSGIGGLVTRAIADAPQPAATPGYLPRVVDKDLYAGKSESDQMFLDEATSHEDAMRRDINIQYRDTDMATAASHGTGMAIAAALYGGLPEGVLTGLGAARVFTMGRAAIAAEGAVAKAGAVIKAGAGIGEAGAPTGGVASQVAQNFGEQLTGNLGNVGVQSAFDPYVSKEDPLMAVGMSVLGAGLHGLGVHASDDTAAMATGQHLMDTSAEAMQKYRDAAVKNLGPDADPSALRTEVSRLEGNDVRNVITDGTSVVDPGRRLMPDPEDITAQVSKGREDTIAAEPTPVAKPDTAPAAEEPKIDTDPTYTPVADVPTHDLGAVPKAPDATTSAVLPKELQGAKPRYKGNSLQFESDVDRAAYITAQTKPSKSDAAYLKFVQDSTGMTEAEVRAHGQTVRDSIKGLAAEAKPDGKIVVPDHAPNLDGVDLEAPKGWGSVGGTDEFTGARIKQRTENPLFFHDAGSPFVRESLARNNPEWRANVAALGEGVTMEDIDRMPHGLTVRDDIRNDPTMDTAVQAVRDITDQFLPKDSKVILGKMDIEHSTAQAAKALGKAAGAETAAPHGAVISAGKTHVIGLNTTDPKGAIMTAIHEVGHVIYHEFLTKIPAGLRGRMAEEFQAYIKQLGEGNAMARFKRFAAKESNFVDANGKLRGALPDHAYAASFDEYTAEAFARYIQDRANAGTGPKLSGGVIDALKEVWNKVQKIWEWARGKGHLAADEAFPEFFDHVLNGTLDKADDIPMGEASYLSPDLTPDFNVHFDPEAQRIGLDLAPQGTVQQEAEAHMILAIHQKANEYAKTHLVDPARMSKLLKNTIFDPISTVMLRSTNKVVRMVSAELMENGGGAGGRRSTAAIGKWLHERSFMGNSINDVQTQYTQWRNLQGGTVYGDYSNGRLWKTFNKQVAEEIESRRDGATKIQSSPQVVAAADVVQKGYERMAAAQKGSKTVGWKSLPETSEGYMPHQMSRDKVMNMSVAEKNALHSALTDQFMAIEGYDPSFSAQLASKYVDRVQRAAVGDYTAVTGIHQTGAAAMVEDALKTMGLSQEQVTAMMKKYMAAGPGHTKRRLRIDLTATHDDGKGGTFRLLDLYETDQLKLLRQQATTVSGEVALAQHGVMGKAGLGLLRRAMQFGADGEGPATTPELEAFDQMAAELTGQPFGTAAGKWADRAMQFNTLARMGGVGFNKMGEYINGIVHVGAGKTLAAMGNFPRLRAEAAALARGEHVENPLISSLEKFGGGAEFGTDPYKMVFPFDPGEAGEYSVYGKDSPNMADRVLRGGMHLQGKLSFWRAIHGAQHRGFAEQIVLKSLEYIRSGKDDIALNDMGIDANLRAKMAAELPNMVGTDAQGRVSFDITKMKDTQAAMDYVQAVHRGVNQIIQETFVGERGKWVHNGFMRMLMQFRSFGITSIEKQWARQVGSRGPAAALGILLGSMSMAAPVYAARVMLNAQGRSDKDKYIAENLTAAHVARQTLNYVSLSGVTSDLLDALSAVTGIGEATGGRASMGKSFVGNVVAPAAGIADDLYKGIQNTKTGTNPHDLLKALPFSNLPGMVPVIEGLTGK